MREPLVSQSSQGQFHPSQSTLSPSSPPVQSPYSYPPTVIESPQAGPAAGQEISSTVPRPRIVHPVGQGNLVEQGQGPRNSLEQLSASAPHPSLPLGSAYPVQEIANSSCDFSQTRGDPSVRQNMASYPIAMSQEAYMAGQIPHNLNVWASRPATTMDQSFCQPQLIPSGYMDYNVHGLPQGYYQPGCSTAQYLPAQGPHIRSPPISPPASYACPSNSMPSAPLLAEQPLVPSSPSYMINQQDYSFPETPSLPSSQSSLPVSPQHQPQPHPQPQTTYSSPEATPTTSEYEHSVRMISSRQRPQCWDHGCNGREFSTFSNLLRHQREKSGAVAKAECPTCGAVFTRSTARNIHVAQGKCKGMGIGRY